MRGPVVNIVSGALILASIVSLAGAGNCPAGTPASPRQVRNIRFWTAPEKTRVVIDMSSDSRYEVKVMTDPHRVVIDIPSGRFSNDIRNIEINDGLITRIRVNRLRSRAQVVLDLPEETPFTHFALGPNKVHPHRIVIDLKKVLTSRERSENRARVDRVVQSGDIVVVIDPGHGGSQPGACSRYGPREKDLVLDLSRLVAARIDGHRGFKAVLTRNGDYDVGHYRRVKIAREHGGDCFVSIHMNSSESPRPRGSGVYFLSVEGASDENAEAVAERENMLLELGEEGNKIEGDVQSILFDFARNDAVHQSSILAGCIAERMSQVGSIPFRGIKQANFMVLRGIAMPSVLIEAVFISNRKDVNLIRKRAVQENIADAVSSGIIKYLTENPPPEKEALAGRVAIHTVSSGETLWEIARRYGTTIDSIRDLNGLGKSSRIRVGQKLRVYR